MEVKVLMELVEFTMVTAAVATTTTTATTTATATTIRGKDIASMLHFDRMAAVIMDCLQ